MERLHLAIRKSCLRRWRLGNSRGMKLGCRHVSQRGNESERERKCQQAVKAGRGKGDSELRMRTTINCGNGESESDWMEVQLWGPRLFAFV